MAKAKQTESLDGWQEIAEFLGQPSSVAQRWAKSGMPVTHEGRRVQIYSPSERNRISAISSLAGLVNSRFFRR
jgi:hypothetical protein